jgi:SSS family solute:Na+ symporter
MNPADLIVVVGFFAIMAGIGIYFGRRMKNASDFFRGGGGIPWWLAGVSFYMTTFSALAFVVYSALAYQYGFVAVSVSWVTVPALILGARFFAARWRRVGQNSPLEFLEMRYGGSVRQTIVWTGLGMRLLDDALKLFAVGTLLSVGMGVPMLWAIIGATSVILVYTILGGLWATVVADFVQFGIILAATFSLIFLVISALSPVEFVAQAPSGFFSPTTDQYGIFYILIFFILVFYNYTTNWPLIQRYASVRSDREARKVGYLVAALSFLAPPLFYVPAMFAKVLLPDIADPNSVYAVICRTFLPAGLFGLVLAAMFSGTMSTLAGSFNSAAQVLSRDVYGRLFSKNQERSSRHMLIVGRIFTFIMGALVTALAFHFYRGASGDTDLFAIMASIFGFFIPPIALTMLLGLMIPPVSKNGANAGIIMGISAGIIVYLIGFSYPHVRNAEWIMPITSTATLLGMLAFSILQPGDKAYKTKVSGFFADLRQADASAKVQDVKATGSIAFILKPLGFAFLSQGLVLSIAASLFSRDTHYLLALGVSAFFAIIGIILIKGSKK